MTYSIQAPAVYLHPNQQPKAKKQKRKRISIKLLRIRLLQVLSVGLNRGRVPGTWKGASLCLTA